MQYLCDLLSRCAASSSILRSSSRKWSGKHEQLRMIQALCISVLRMVLPPRVQAAVFIFSVHVATFSSLGGTLFSVEPWQQPSSISDMPD